jgi:hypothetical protein
MKAILAVFSALILFSSFTFGQRVLTDGAIPGDVANALKKMGVNPYTAAIEEFVYGPFVSGASGDQYLPDGEYDRYFNDMYTNWKGPNEILLFKGTFDKQPFPNRKMNSAFNRILGDDRCVTLLDLAKQMAWNGGIRMYDLLPAEESGNRVTIVYRVVPKDEPATATVAMVDSLKAQIADLTKKVAAVEAAQPAPEDVVPFNGIHGYVGVFIGGELEPTVSDGTPDLPLVPRGCTFTLSFNGRQKIGVGIAGAYEGQGGISLFAETDLYDFYGRGATLIAGTSFSTFRKLDLTQSPRSARYGQLYVGMRGLLDIVSREHPIEFVMAFGTSFKVLTTHDGGLSFQDWNVRGIMLRVSYMVF